MATTFVGTMCYMPPERFTPQDPYQYDIRADVWSLGITLLEVVYGKLPYYYIGSVTEVSENIIEMGNIIVNSSPEKLIQGIYKDGYSSSLVDFTTKCLHKLENRPKLKELVATKFYRKIKDTKFYQKHKYASNQETVREFVSHVSNSKDYRMPVFSR